MEQGDHRYGRPQLSAPVMEDKQDRRRKRRIYTWIAAGGLLAVALCAVGIALLREPPEPPKPPVNRGVAAAQQYITEYKLDREALMSGPQKELGERLLTKPFEIEADITVSADNLQQIAGLPLSRLILGLDAKYDLNDLGAKLRLLGMEYASAYLIGDDVVLSVMGDVYSMPLAEPKQGLEESMGLGDRMNRFVPLLSEDMAFYTRLADIAARSVPDEYTTVYDDDTFSPLDGADAGMTVIETALDESALQTVAANIDALLRQDAELRAQAEEMLLETAAFYGFNANSLDEWLAAVADGSAIADDFELRWRVYERDGRYVGLAVKTSQGGQVTEYKMLSELNGHESHEAFSLSVNGEVFQSADYTVVYDSGNVKLEGTYRPDTSNVFSFVSDMTFEKNGDAYKLAGTVDIDGPLLSDEPQPVNIAIDADIRAGEGLETMKESRGWQDIYSETWNSLTQPWQDMIFP